MLCPLSHSQASVPLSLYIQTTLAEVADDQDGVIFTTLQVSPIHGLVIPFLFFFCFLRFGGELLFPFVSSLKKISDYLKVHNINLANVGSHSGSVLLESQILVLFLVASCIL